jgi:hypothetical protein
MVIMIKQGAILMSKIIEVNSEQELLQIREPIMNTIQEKARRIRDENPLLNHGDSLIVAIKELKGKGLLPDIIKNY